MGATRWLPWLALLAGMDAHAHDAPVELLVERVQSGYVEPFRSGEVERWLEVFTDDVIALHDGPPRMDGKDQLRAFAEVVHSNFAIRRFEVVVDEVRMQGDWAMTVGHYLADFQPRTEQAYAPASGPRQGKFMFLWVRDGNGWRIMTDMGNSTDQLAP